MSIKKIVRKIIKEIWGIDGISLFVKKQKKKVMQRIYTKKYSSDDLITKMRDMGMKNGSVVFVHSSMTEFYNYQGTAIELIEKIIDEIGQDGTILMPAYPPKKQALFKIASETDEIVFNVNQTVSGAGYLSEVFRTYPNVKRSINLQHSVCAYGKLADYFTSEHHLSETAWDENSPYYKLAQIDGLIFSMGLDSSLRNVTMIHCIEASLRHKYLYFASFFGKNIKYKFLDQFNNVGYHYMTLPLISGIRSEKVIKKYFDKSKFKTTRLSNLNIELVESNYMYKRLLELTNRGVSIYSQPSSKGFLRNGLFIKIDETSNKK